MRNAMDAPLLPRLDESLADTRSLQVTPDPGRHLLDSALLRYELVQRQYDCLRRTAPVLARDYLEGEVHGSVAQAGHYFDLWNPQTLMTDLRSRMLRDTIHGRLNRIRQALEHAGVDGYPIEVLPSPLRLPRAAIKLLDLRLPKQCCAAPSPEWQMLHTALDCFAIAHRQYDNMLESCKPLTRTAARLYLVTDLNRSLWRVERRFQKWTEACGQSEATAPESTQAQALATCLRRNRYALWRATWGALANSPDTAGALLVGA